MERAVSEAGEELDLKQVFLQFLRTFKDEKGRFKYRERIQEMVRNEKITLQIDYEDLLLYDSRLIKVLEEDPAQALNALSESIRLIVNEEYPEFAKEVRRFYGRLTGWVKSVPIREIKAEHINKLVMVDGIVVKATPPRQKIFKAVYLHMLPNGESHEFEWPPHPEEELGDELERPTYCPVCLRELLIEEERQRTPRGSFKLVVEKSKFRNWQLIVLQERPEEIPSGQIPRSIEVVLTDDLVDTVRPGDRATVIGIVKLQKPSRRIVRPIFTSYIEANNVLVAQRFLEELKLSPEDEEKIIELSKDPLIRRKIVASIAPAIFGWWDIKEAVALLLFGGVTKSTREGERIRGEIHVLLVGDPGTAKSQILQYAVSIAPRGVYTAGKGSSAAGLTAAVVKEKQSGEYFLEAGAMVLADGGIVAIDEIDKMREEDRSAIHVAMEQGFVSIAKAGIVAKLNARTSVLAAGNPKRGRYVDELSVIENINLPRAIITRFDLIFILRDIAEIERDRLLVKHILKTHEMYEEVRPEIDPELLRKYIAYARKNVKPKLTEEAMRIIYNYYIELRKRSALDPNVPLPITARQLDALVRLAEAHAKMALKDYVEAEDAAEAVRLVNSMLESAGIDVESGQIDIDNIMTGIPKSLREKEVVILNILRELLSEGEPCVKLGRIQREAEKFGIDDRTVNRILRNLRRVGDVFEKRSGCYALVE